MKTLCLVKKKATHKNFILYDTIYMKCLEQTARRLTVARLGECWIKGTGHRHTPEVTPDTRGCQTYKTPPPHSLACTVTHWPHTHNWVFICTPWSKHPPTYHSAGAGTRGPSSLPAPTAMPSRVRAPLVDLRLLGHSHRAHSRPSLSHSH